MKTNPLTPRQLDTIRSMDEKLLHRPLAERAAFLRDFLKLKTSEDELVKVITSQRLEYLRGEIEAERISYGEIAELEDLKEHIDPGDVLLLQWAGVPETPTTMNQ